MSYFSGFPAGNGQPTAPSLQQSSINPLLLMRLRAQAQANSQSNGTQFGQPGPFSQFSGLEARFGYKDPNEGLPPGCEYYKPSLGGPTNSNTQPTTTTVSSQQGESWQSPLPPTTASQGWQQPQTIGGAYEQWLKEKLSIARNTISQQEERKGKLRENLSMKQRQVTESQFLLRDLTNQVNHMANAVKRNWQKRHMDQEAFSRFLSAHSQLSNIVENNRSLVQDLTDITAKTIEELQAVDEKMALPKEESSVFQSELQNLTNGNGKSTMGTATFLRERYGGVNKTIDGIQYLSPWDKYLSTNPTQTPSQQPTPQFNGMNTNPYDVFNASQTQPRSQFAPTFGPNSTQSQGDSDELQRLEMTARMFEMNGRSELASQIRSRIQEQLREKVEQERIRSMLSGMRLGVNGIPSAIPPSQHPSQTQMSMGDLLAALSER